MENRPILSENEKIALMNGGESTSRIMTLDGKTAEDVIEERNVKNFNEQVDKYVEKLNEHAANLDNYAKKVAENIETIEIMPIGNYVLVKEFAENPFQRIVRDSKSGLILDLGGQKPQYKNTDNGQIEEEIKFLIRIIEGFNFNIKKQNENKLNKENINEEEENIIRQAVIQEVGPECKWCKPNDVIMYTKMSAVPVPFYKQGLVLVNETRVLVVINEGLSKRFEDIKNGK